MASVLFIDFETYSTAKLGKVGTYRYAADPSFAPVLLGYAFDDDPVVVHDFRETGGRLPATLASYINMGGVVAGYGQFDRIVLGAMGHRVPPRRYIDIMALAAVAGYPKSLAGCGEALGCQTEKLKTAGKDGIKKFCKPVRRKRKMPEDYPEAWEHFVEYAGADVELAREIYHILPPLPPTEQALYELTADMNDRGIGFDVQGARTLAEMASEIKARADALITEATKGEVTAVGQVARIAEFCGLPSVAEKTLRDALPGMTPEQRLVGRLRLAAGKSSTAKMETGLDAVLEGLIHGALFYCGTITRRWAGRIIQPQNMPRDCFNADKTDEFLALAAQGYRAVVAQYPDPLKAISKALRGIIVPSQGHLFVVVDYSQIEARVLAWIAGQRDAIQRYRDGVDQYKAMAAQVFNVPEEEVTDKERFIGKTLILGAGYNLGAAGFQRNLSGMGVEVSLKEAARYISAFREKFNTLPVLWKQLSSAFREAFELKEDGRLDVGDHLVFEKRTIGGKPSVFIHLPSGSVLAYHQIIEDTAPAPWDENELILQLFALNPKNSKRYAVGPQTLTENVCSCIARDLMGSAMLRCEQKGIRVVLTVHDEIVCEVPDTPEWREHGVERVSKIMCKLPAWGRDLPLKTEGKVMHRYGK